MRKIRRSVARYNIKQQDIKIFGKYAVVNVNGKNVLKSFFARSWRSWL